MCVGGGGARKIIYVVKGGPAKKLLFRGGGGRENIRGAEHFSPGPPSSVFDERSLRSRDMALF